MLNNQCKQVLNLLIRIKKNNLEFNGSKTFKKHLPTKTFNNISYIMKYLKDEGYLDYFVADNDFYTVNLTYKGLAYKSFNFESLKSFIKKSIIVPIIVSAITTLITMWLQHL